MQVSASFPYSFSATFAPMIDIGFWTTLSRKKLEEFKLDKSAKKVCAKYKLNNFADKTPNSHLFLDVYSFSDDKSATFSGPVEVVLQGNLIVLNTVEEFRAFDRENAVKEILQEFSETQKAFSLVVFADLKSHVFSYQFLTPNLKEDGISVKNISEIPKEFAEVLEKSLRNHLLSQKRTDYFLYARHDSEQKSLEIVTFAEFSALFKQKSKEIFVIFVDSYNQPTASNGFLKLALASLADSLAENQDFASFSLILLKDFFYHNPDKCISFKNSRFLELDFPVKPLKSREFDLKPCDSRTLDLKSFIDEATLAENAVNLNIKLMKWRLCPEISLEKIHDLRVLCFGAGTLGCQLSRNLIGWGVKNIDFVDYGKVSYSNPVRQSLFTFEDSTKGGKLKAEAAAESLKKIFPSINSQGFHLEIPMPGHFVSTKEQAEKVLGNLETIEKLVENHDVLFLLTDTRESRWLPTVLANKYNKLCISVALGFDSYVVIRHGVSPKQHKFEIHGERLACYFCNDILTPNNSLSDRTLDQQCTVTRPGVSFIASAYASELLISLLHHPLWHAAGSSDELCDMSNTCLGVLPQHIRGNLSDFETKTLYGKAFENCIACSEYVLDEYLKNREEFLLKVINSPDFLQDVTKITETLQAMDLENAIICLDDEEEEEKKKE